MRKTWMILGLATMVATATATWAHDGVGSNYNRNQSYQYYDSNQGYQYNRYQDNDRDYRERNYVRRDDDRNYRDRDDRNFYDRQNHDRGEGHGRRDDR